uniref:Uncharacterized protein n=1 Tax=Panagrolaimus sp. JU765 TaxID=591449 RepID=A0AC34RE32_9BILA
MSPKRKVLTELNDSIPPPNHPTADSKVADSSVPKLQDDDSSVTIAKKRKLNNASERYMDFVVVVKLFNSDELDGTQTANDSDGTPHADDSDGVQTANDSDGIPHADDSDGTPNASDSDGVQTANDSDGIPHADDSDGTPNASDSDGVQTANDSDGTQCTKNDSTELHEEPIIVKTEPSEIEETVVEERNLRGRLAVKPIKDDNSKPKARYPFRSRVKPPPKPVQIVKELKAKTENERLAEILQKKRNSTMETILDPKYVSNDPEIVPSNRWILPCDDKKVAKWCLYIVSPNNPSIGCKLCLGGLQLPEVFYYCQNCYEKRKEEVKAYVAYNNKELTVKMEPNEQHEKECFTVDLAEELKNEKHILVNAP